MIRSTFDAGDASPGQSLPITLADVLARLEANPSSDRRHVEMKSAIRRMGEVLRRSLIDIPADPAELRKLITAASRASVGMTKERWSRVRSLTLAALRDLGVDMMPGRDVGGSSAGWKQMTQRLPTKAAKVGLSRFMSHCTRQGIEPAEVTVETFCAFHDALSARSLTQGPESLYRGTVRHWNRAVRAVPQWPRLTVPLETHPHFYSLAWEQFPASFTADVEAFLANSANQSGRDELDDDYIGSVKPSTVALRRRQLRQLASVLIASGFSIEELTSLAVLVDPENAKAALRFQKERQGGSITISLGQQAWLLCTIARYWVKAPEQADELRKTAKRLDVKPRGMTARNRERLRQFDLRPNLDALLNLPAEVLQQAKREKGGSPAQARRVMLAAAVELLLVAPMRVGNLTGLEHDRHFVEVGRGHRRNRYIIIPEHETKTGAPFEVILPEGSALLIDAYLKTYRSRICAVPSAFLFPNSDGARRGTISFSKSISDFVLKETGIKMHVHLFRQLAGKLYLDAHPSDLETVRRVLGHTTTATTARYYAEQRTSQAFGAYDQTLSKLRASADRLTPRKPGRAGR
jgi:integrase